MNERRVLEEIQLERGLDGEFLFVPPSDSASNEIELAMLYQVKNDAPLYVGIGSATCSLLKINLRILLGCFQMNLWQCIR